MEVRRAGPGDATSAANAYIASLQSLDFLPRLHTHDELHAFVGRLLEEQEVWVAEDGGGILGLAALTSDMLSHLYVHPDAQGRGAGAALLAKTKERRPEGFTFWVFQQNERARRFYEAHGCRVVQLTDGAGNDEKTPDALYAWAPGEV